MNNKQCGDRKVGRTQINTLMPGIVPLSTRFILSNLYLWRRNGMSVRIPRLRNLVHRLHMPPPIIKPVKRIALTPRTFAILHRTVKHVPIASMLCFQMPLHILWQGNLRRTMRASGVGFLLRNSRVFSLFHDFQSIASLFIAKRDSIML
jgi:hypothetical protein